MSEEKTNKYDAKRIEEKTISFWNKNKIYEKAKAKNAGKKKFYYLDGPPYTTGKIHIGHAWGKALRDSILRYKRLQGFDVWDQPGFDMHGLPIEVSVEKKFGINDKKEIIEKYGMQKFIEMCQEYALEQLYPMIDDFKRLGVWMNWDDPYMTIKNEYIEGVWWALKRAHQNKYLYQGKKAMSWCPRCATALAKHELEYENVTDDSIFVKLPVVGREDTYFIIWTTTPWTIPFNLAVMAHPDFEYVEARTEDDETWILSKGLSTSVIGGVANKKFKVIKTYKGEKLGGVRYKHIFEDEIPYHKKIDEENPKTHTVLLTDKYVDLSAGTGLVHCAPGCGAEDFEVGRSNGIPAFNEIDDHGVFNETTGVFSGLIARKDDKKFIQKIKEKGALIESTKVDHEYAHCWRCKTDVIYKATDQWFLATEKARDELVKQNKKVSWVPEWAGNKWFDSWLRNLQDWCISRQRFWGIPLPIWKCSCGETRLVESGEELKKLTGKKLDNLHRPWIDKIKIRCEKCDKMTSRVEDILDVWLDSGAAPWATLGYPSNKKLYERLGDVDFILEGKDQIRGWFNSLACLSMVSQKKIPFKTVYMHGFINDSKGRKMSKSLKNIISPYEVIDTQGADTLRYYGIGGSRAGLDLNYNFEDMKTKNKNLFILWNLQNYLFDLTNQLKVNPEKLKVSDLEMGLEEEYMLSKLNSSISLVTKLFDEYRLNEVPSVIEELFLELSRTYIQLVRDKASIGSDEEKKTVSYIVYKTLTETLKLLAPITPFISEEIYLNFKAEYGLKEESVHLVDWPKTDNTKINVSLEQSFLVAKEVISATLSARERANLGIRWPVKKLIVVSKDKKLISAAKKLLGVIKQQTNVKEIEFKESFSKVEFEIKPNYKALGQIFGKDTAIIGEKIRSADSNKLVSSIKEKGLYKIGKYEIKNAHIEVSEKVSLPYFIGDFRFGGLYVDSTRTPELEAEGYARELMRRVQVARKNLGLQKLDDIRLLLVCDEKFEKLLKPHNALLKEKVGAKQLVYLKDEPKHAVDYHKTEKIKDYQIKILVEKINK
ncbi:isoleucine--tRNA ligase [Candidatus Woesearchaeota archaeon]|nr:isoleucine--tRNA ligase [Candidatus Woesearchaeota archaeon]